MLIELSNTYKKEPMRLNTQAIGGPGSVRPGESKSLYIRQPYESLDHVLDLMRDQVQKWKGDQRIRQKAVEITKGIPKDSRTGLPDRRNYQAIADAVYSWMKKNIAYVRDPDGIELLQSPLKTISYGNGDCDDHSILAAALLSSLGVPTKFKVVKTNPNNRNAYSHIYVVYRADGDWKAFDTTLHAAAGSELSDSRMFGHKFISLSDAETIHRKKKMMNLNTSTESSRLSSAYYDNPTFSNLSGPTPAPENTEKNRIALREQLVKYGFSRTTGIYNNGKNNFNMGAYNVSQLNNLARLYQQFPQQALEYHNSRQMHKDTLNNVDYWAQKFNSTSTPSSSANSVTPTNTPPPTPKTTPQPQTNTPQPLSTVTQQSNPVSSAAPMILVGSAILLGAGLTVYSIKRKKSK